MTDRVAGYLVTLAEDVREDDDAAIVTALQMVSGVVGVEPVPASFEQAIARSRRDVAWIEALRKTIEEMRG